MLSRTQGWQGHGLPPEPHGQVFGSSWQPRCWRMKPGGQEAAERQSSLGARLNHTHCGTSPGRPLGCPQQQPGGFTAASESQCQGLDQGDRLHPKTFQCPST